MRVYDKAKYHAESVEDFGLPADHAANHTVVFLRWLIDNDLTSDEFRADRATARYRAGQAGVHAVYAAWDCCLAADMLSDRGNAFATAYFDFQHGAYIGDYIATLQGDLPSEYHVAYTEANYGRLRPVIDRRYAAWAAGRSAGRSVD